MSEMEQCNREKYWEEKSDSEKIEKLAEAVEILGRSVVELEKENCLLRQHSHLSEGLIVAPVNRNQVEQPWYKTHLLNREATR